MKVPPAATYRSRIANAVASSVAVPKRMAPRLSTLTSRRVFGSVPIVRYFMRVPHCQPSLRQPSLVAGARSMSNLGRGRAGHGHAGQDEQAARDHEQRDALAE